MKVIVHLVNGVRFLCVANGGQAGSAACVAALSMVA